MSLGGLRHIVFSLMAGVLAACDLPPSAPPFAATPIQTDVDGFRQLFLRECIEQRSRAWALQESARRSRVFCHHFMNGEGEAGDCDNDMVGHVAWTVPTIEGSGVQIELDWIADAPFPPRQRELNCAISVFEHDGPALQAAAIALFGDSPTFWRDERTEYYEWSQDTPSRDSPRLRLLHGRFAEDTLTGQYDPHQVHHDWQLSRPFDIQYSRQNELGERNQRSVDGVGGCDRRAREERLH